MLPFQAQGPVSATPPKGGIRLAAPNEPSPSVSLSASLEWPSAWQLWQLIQFSSESRAS